MTTNTNYWGGLVKKYGNNKTGAEDKSQRFKSDFKMEELIMGFKVLNGEINTVSIVTDKTETTIEVLNLTNRKNVYLSGAKDADGEIQTTGRRKGIDSKNWYLLEDFNRTFKRTKQ